MTRTKPPFRADHVGSILRTAPIKEARAKREKGEISVADLKAVEDREIEKIIRQAPQLWGVVQCLSADLWEKTLDL